MQGQAQLLDGVEAADPEQVLPQRADEALDAAVALGLAHEGGRAFDPEEGELPLVVIGDDLAAMIVRSFRPPAMPSSAGARAHALLNGSGPRPRHASGRVMPSTPSKRDPP